MRIAFLTIPVAAAVLVAGTMTAPTVHAEDDGVKVQEPELISLRFYADWCGFCRALDEKLDEVKKEFSGAPVLFTHVDLTDEYTKEQSGLLAAQLGVASIYEEYGNSTGDMVLIDPETGEVKEHITHEVSKDELRQRISAALDADPAAAFQEGSGPKP